MSPATIVCLKTMNSESQQRINYLISTLRSYWVLLIVPAIIGLVLATLYAFLIMPEMWTARQSFLIRDDLSGTAFKPGRFDSEESRKSAQETILEVARRPLVVRSVLEKLGPESMMAGNEWITDEEIEDTQKAIDISAPNGAEFGKTDAIVLTAKASSRERTRKFIELLSEEITTQTNRVRSLRFESMETESGQAYQAAVEARDEAIDRLTALDQRLGSDFGFLTLQSGQNNFNNQPTGVETIKAEILRKQGELEEAQTVLAALLKAFNNPETASQLPSKVLTAQPNLENVMARLLDFQEQLHLAKGLYSDKHARVRSIKKSIAFLQHQLYHSLTGEMSGVQADIKLKKRQIAGLQDRLEKQKSRLIRLSKARSEHMALKTQVDQLGEAANRAKTGWTEIKARANTARTVGLLTPTDVAQVNSRPDGIGKKAIALAGLLGGLMIGTGLILALAPPMDPKPASGLTTAPRPTQVTNTDATNTPRQQLATPTGNFTVSGNSISGASFQHAASAMQSAADAMQLAASGETAAQQPATSQSPTPRSQPAPSVAQPQPPQQRPVARQAIPQQQAKAKNPAPEQQSSEAIRSATQKQSAALFPKDPRSQPVGQTNAVQQPKAKSTAQLKTRTAPATPPVNVRPVDLAKSASKNNDFVRVPSDTVVNSPTDTKNPQRATSDSKVSKSARAIADSVSNKPANPPQRIPVSTIAMSDDEKTKVMQDTGVRQPMGTEPFVLTADGETTESPATSTSQDINEAIPEQIRKLSDSIMNFGKDKK